MLDSKNLFTTEILFHLTTTQSSAIPHTAKCYWGISWQIWHTHAHTDMAVGILGNKIFKFLCSRSMKRMKRITRSQGPCIA